MVLGTSIRMPVKSKRGCDEHEAIRDAIKRHMEGSSTQPTLLPHPYTTQHTRACTDPQFVPAMEMEAAPVSAVTGALKSVLGKLATLMGDEHKRLGMARGEEIKSLADELCAMDAALLDMSGKEDPAAQDKAWMNEARELSYDMEDSIDDFMQTIRDEGVEPDHGFFMEKMKDSLEKMKASRPTGDDLKEQINRVGKGTGRYETRGTFSNTVHATVDPAAIAMFELLTKQDGPKAELIKLLTEDEADCSEPLLAEVDGGHESLLAEEEGGCESPLAEAEDGSELPLVQEEDGCESPKAEEEEEECESSEVEEEGVCEPAPAEEEECELPEVEEEGACEPAPAEEEEYESPEMEEEDVCEPAAAEEEECESPEAKDEDVCEPAPAEEDECESPQAEEEGPCELRPRKQPKLVAIVGAGGTALANKVYEELRVKDFDYWPFISMSANPDMTSTLTALLLELTGEFKKTASVEQLIIDINESLLDKRYLIVIDGICQKETWEVIKHAFPMTSCGIIITTSPCEDIAELCRSSFNGHIYHIRPLGMVHSRPLLHQRLFNSDDDCRPHIEEVSDQILEKCDDLPLAILLTSGLLANTERTEHLWNHMADSIGCALETSDIAERMMKILSLCYFDLHPRLKTCLLYLSMFPKGSTIKMKDLIWRWTAEGFFHGEQRNAAHELGEMCFNELLNRSLIQPVKIDQYGKVKSCQVHDTVMDYIISKSVEDNFVTFVGAPCPTIDQTQMKVRRFSLQATEGGYSFPGTDLVLSHARSLKAFGLLWEIPSLDKFKHLRVVDFGGFSLLGDDDLAYIGRLFQLRYLNLSWTRVCELPEEIGNLCCLEMLDLTATGVSKLPSSIVNLEKLAHLLIGEFVKFPEGGIEKMQALETLKQVRAFKQPLQFLQDFGKLQNLWKLNIDLTNNQEDSEETKECMKAIASSLYELGTHNLRSLTIWNCDYSLLLEEWCPTPVGLQKLITWSSTFPRVPDWMGSLVNLQQLRLDLERVRYEDLCILGGLPALLTLQIVGKEMSEGKLTVNGDMGFPMLRDFTYSKYPGLGIEIMFEAGSMPKLEKLNIDFTPATNEYLFSTGGLTGSGPFDFGIENLPISLTTVVCDCKSFDGDCTLEATRAALERAVSTHPSCPALDFVIY
ncbi:disease resistance protein RGA5-like isoform X1 [Hordeum vulgare subsp. vulgare]|uniref:NB-ARC domain-containing protein n=1 Tax=Hordeum vulgare subsp. vulgare TaxID=112509 RepID=A0A8I6YZA0_HORVV|nr:disease resistance protein RGA5-like isoform X1 [Hordeum vulgare subsp. vulgare]